MQGRLGRAIDSVECEGDGGMDEWPRHDMTWQWQQRLAECMTHDASSVESVCDVQSGDSEKRSEEETLEQERRGMG